MGTGKQVKVVIFASYSEGVYEMLQALLGAGTSVAHVAFAPATIRRLSWKKRLKNLLTYRALNEPSALLRKHGVPFSFIESHNNAAAAELLIDVDVLLLYGTVIIKERILALPRIGVLNAHSSLLPKYRGSRAAFWMLYHNEPEYAGVTIHWVTPGLDDGDVFLQEPIKVGTQETPESLRQKSAPIAGRLFAECLSRIGHGDILRIPQDTHEATRYGRPTAEDKREFMKRRHAR